MSSIPETLKAGLAAHRAGRLVEAEYMYRRVLEAQPNHAGAFHLLGLLAFQMGKHEMAAQLVNDAIRFDAFKAIFPADLGEIYRTLGKIPEAIAAYRQSLRLNFEAPDAHTNLGTLLQAHGDLNEAVTCYREALELDPQYAPAHHNLGAALTAQGQWVEAQAAFEACVRLTPDDAQSYLDLGHCLQSQGKLLEAVACYQKAIRLQPNSAEAHYRCGMARLLGGNFAAGWPEYEWGQQPRLAERRFSQRTWNGADLRGRRILIHTLCPLADTLQFIRYVPLVQQRGGVVTVEVEPVLLPLMEQSGFTPAIAVGGPTPACDVQVSLLSLPRIFGTTLDSIPAAVPYLAAPGDLIRTWHNTLAGFGGFRVGIVWQGDPAGDAEGFRSIPLAEFLPLAQVPGVTLISLQKKDSLDRLSALGGAFSVVDLGQQLDEAHGAFMDTAAVMRNLDLVITSDSAAAHLAGAMGVPVWIALSFAADWRWLEERADSPWYPSARLFRQSVPGQWGDVFQNLADALAQAVLKRSPSP
ncbi:MAG TPA: tetratricopeptide repeat-containing glycosyltransferase family protein [Pirellulales bacterium]|nr:tetratricopeptide repeat-containing glycosyltransferase family protein [Pirellulales bacterium]